MPDAFALRSRRVVTPEGEREAAVVVRDGVIAGLVAPEAIPPDLPVVDASGLVVLPGLVDSHVHVNEPGRTDWEGFRTATRAAAAGGITTLVDMPLNSIPVTTSAAALDRKREAAAAQIHVDCAFWGGLVPGNAGDIGKLLDAGASGVKAFLCPSGIDDFPAATEDDLRAALPLLAERGAPLIVHAELASGPPGTGVPQRYATYLASRPASWEEAAVAMLLRLCAETRGPIHVVHLSAATAANLVAEAKREGLPLTAETCPHYLSLDAESIPDGRTEFKCAPPIREASNREALWEALGRGIIDLVVSDHSPCPPEMKGLDRGDFLEAWGGITSLQLSLPVVWTEAEHRGFGLTHIARWMAEAPARLAGLGHRKGRIAAGCDADLVLFDPDGATPVHEGTLRHRHKLTPYLGRTLKGAVSAVYLRGRRLGDGTRPGGHLLSANHGLH